MVTDGDVEASAVAVVALHDLWPKRCFRRKTVEAFMRRSAGHLKIKKEFVESFIMTNTCRIMNMSRAVAQATGKQKATWVAHCPWMANGGDEKSEGDGDAAPPKKRIRIGKKQRMQKELSNGIMTSTWTYSSPSAFWCRKKKETETGGRRCSPCGWKR